VVSGFWGVGICTSLLGNVYILLFGYAVFNDIEMKYLFTIFMTIALLIFVALIAGVLIEESEDRAQHQVYKEK